MPLSKDHDVMTVDVPLFPPSPGVETPRQGRVDENLVIYADYSEAGSGRSRVRAYSLFATWSCNAESLDARVKAAIARHVPEAIEAEDEFYVHLTDLENGRWWQRNFPRIDSIDKSRSFIRDLCARIGIMPKTHLVVAASISEALVEPSELLREAFSNLNDALRVQGVNVGNCEVVIDQGDDFIVHQLSVGRFDDVAEAMTGTFPRYRLESSKLFRGIQVADLAAGVVTKMASSYLDRYAVREGSPTEKSRSDAEYYSELCHRLDLDIIYTEYFEGNDNIGNSAWLGTFHSKFLNSVLPLDLRPKTLPVWVQRSGRNKDDGSQSWQITPSISPEQYRQNTILMLQEPG